MTAAAAGVAVDRASMVKIARQFGEAGKAAPSWVTDDPEFHAAYQQGAGKPPVAFHPPAPAARKAPARPPAKRAPARPAQTRPASSPAKRSPYLARALSPRGAAHRLGADRTVSRVSQAGDGGGLLLAVVLYPVFLATLKYGAQGPMIWFRAKWLNQTTAPDAKSAAPAPLPTAAPPHATKAPGSIGRAAS